MIWLPLHLAEHLDFLARLDRFPVIDREEEARRHYAATGHS